MEWIQANKDLIEVLGKILIAGAGTGVFVRIIYRVSIKYFEDNFKAIASDIKSIKAALWGPDGEPKKGLEYRVDIIEHDHDREMCKQGGKK